MGFFEAIYVDLKKVVGSAVNFVIGVIIVVLLLFLALNGFIFGTCPWWFSVIFVVMEGISIGLLIRARFRGAVICVLTIFVMFGIAVSMSDGGWVSGRQPIEKAVVKFNDGPAIVLLKPRVLAKQIRGWKLQRWPVFDMGMKKPDPEKDIIILGGFTLETSIGFWQLNHETANINLMSVKKIWHKGRTANDKEITLRNGKVICGTCLVFTNFMSMNPGMVWIEGKTPKGDDIKIDFEDFNEKGEYIEFYWEK